MENTKPTDVVDERYPHTPIGIVRSRDAFLRDLPALLANPRYDRWLALYCGDECIGIAESHLDLIWECKRRGLRREDYYLGRIVPQSDGEADEIEFGMAEFEEIDEEEIKGALSFVEFDDDTGTFSGPAISSATRIGGQMPMYTIDDSITNPRTGSVEVTIDFGGRMRWLFFATPRLLESVGDYVEGTRVRLHLGELHMIVVSEISTEIIDKVVRQLHLAGELEARTRPLE